MIPALRSEFNKRFDPASYRRLLAVLDARSGTHVSFRVAETPCFFTAGLLNNLASIGQELTSTLLQDPAYLSASDAAVPAAYYAAGESSHPNFMTADFGLIRQADGTLSPRLVELQAFPSVFAYQLALSEAYRTCYNLDPTLNSFLGGHTEETFWKLLSRVILGKHPPENVVLTEIKPHLQKTLPDFNLTAEKLGIRVMDIRDLVPVKQAGGLPKFHYAAGNRLVPIHRIYNRAIVDELIRDRIQLPFDYRQEFAVEWAGHPNWYFRISKFSIPYLHHPAVPRAIFLDDWFAGDARDLLPADREMLILKPLFSFAGQGIKFAPSDADLDSIPIEHRREYLLQERVRFEPVIDTPFGLTQAEIRILYAWPEDGEMEPVISLIRLGRGMMMGVDHNRDQQWVGGSASFSPGERKAHGGTVTNKN
ncbi:MAG TPA: hypothetical protein VGD64_02735 [Acidisarcina sp.]